jgi:hypothetical protein
LKFADVRSRRDFYSDADPMMFFIRERDAVPDLAFSKTAKQD